MYPRLFVQPRKTKNITVGRKFTLDIIFDILKNQKDHFVIRAYLSGGPVGIIPYFETN